MGKGKFLTDDEVSIKLIVVNYLLIGRGGAVGTKFRMTLGMF